MIPTPFRLYVTTLDDQGHKHSEGPYRFSSGLAALSFLARQIERPVIEASLWEGDTLVGMTEAAS